MTEVRGLLLAFAFGCCYNWLIARWGKSQWGDGFTALWVVGGVAVTLLISSLVTSSLPRLHFYWAGQPLVLSNQAHAAVYELKFFIATGTAMFFGSLWRYLSNYDLHLDLEQ